MHNEMELWGEWEKEAKTQTAETLPAFIAKLMAFDHDYGTICNAIAAAAIGAAWAVERGPRGGITGFQAGRVTWRFLESWNSLKNPARLLDYGNMLYPQYEKSFRAIPKSTWEWLRAEAAKNLAEKDSLHAAVAAHMRAIVEGEVPFGMSIGE